MIFRINETGRSLTEMLGMLAIMGILSVAGVAMYNSAMNKHRANELIYEAQKRATTVAMQITAGRDTLSIGEFPNPSRYVFGVEKNPNNANQFNITIDAVPTDICTQMKTAVGPATAIRIISNDCTKLTFNNDLSTKAYASDYNADQTACKNAGNTWCAYGDNGAGTKCAEGANADCCFGMEYDTRCQKCTASGYVNPLANTTPCDFDGDGVNDSLCNNGVCVDPNVTNGAECTTNADCGGVGSGYYCKITYTEDNLNGKLDSVNTSCFKDLKGTCSVLPHEKRLTASEKSILKKVGLDSALIILAPNLNWWSANNWCQAQGKRLLNMTEMECYHGADNTLIQPGQTKDYCCKQGESCQQSNWNARLWDGKNILPGKEKEVAKYADKMVALRKVIGGGHMWTASPYGNTSQNSCYVFGIYTYSGELFHENNGRAFNGTVLCVSP